MQTIVLRTTSTTATFVVMMRAQAMAGWRFWTSAALLVGCACGVLAADQAFAIEKEPVVVVRRTFDPEHPTDDMPGLTPPEVGLCISEFGCEMKMTTSMVGGRVAATKIESIRMIVRLKITIWTRVLAPEQEIRHEEGHRAISEYYYRDAEVVARGLAEGVIGKQLFRLLRKRRMVVPEDADPVSAASDALQGRMLEEYLAQTHWRCAFAQECFDDITDHGRKPIAEADAVAQAIAEEAASYTGSSR